MKVIFVLACLFPLAAHANPWQDHIKAVEDCKNDLTTLGNYVTGLSSVLTKASSSRTPGGKLAPDVVFSAERLMTRKMNDIEHEFEKLFESPSLAVGDCHEIAMDAGDQFESFSAQVWNTNKVPAWQE